MNYKVSQHTLLFTAGTVWTIAGTNILHIGISCWNGDNHNWMIKAGGATLVFFLFFGFIFQKLYKKHTKRISKKQGKHCPFSFFDAKSWIIMAIMITMGIVIRSLHLMNDTAIAIFYTGLAVALIATGIRFFIYWHRNLSKIN